MNSARRTRAKPSGFTWTHGSYEDKAVAFNLSELLLPRQEMQFGMSIMNSGFASLVAPSGIKQRPSCEGFGK